MADFCTKCCGELFDIVIKPEIDVDEIFDKLELGYYQPGFLCEGCGLIAIMKTNDGEMKVAYITEEATNKTVVWEDYKEPTI